MAAIPNKNNRTEIALRRELHRRGLRYRLHCRAVVGQPDIIFPKERVAVFVDGDYWHGRVLKEGGDAAFRARFKTARREFWRTKLTCNIERDAYVTRTLQRAGWVVLRYWESEASKSLVRTASEIEKVVCQIREMPRPPSSSWRMEPKKTVAAERL